MDNGLVLIARFECGCPSLWGVSEPVASETRLISCPARPLGVMVGDEVTVTLTNGSYYRHEVMAVTDKECCLSAPVFTYIPAFYDDSPPEPVVGKRKRNRMQKESRRKIRYSGVRVRLAKTMGMQFYALRRCEEGKSLSEIAELMELPQEKVQWLISAAQSYRPAKFCTTDVCADYLEQLRAAQLL